MQPDNFSGFKHSSEVQLVILPPAKRTFIFYPNFHLRVARNVAEVVVEFL
jgi:hypothetical protein